MNSYPRRESTDVVREFLSLPDARVLDVGCGDGSLVRMMVREGAQATGLEISDSQLARARAESPVGGESYRVGRAEALPFEGKIFDVVVFFNSLHHVPIEFQEKALAIFIKTLPAKHPHIATVQGNLEWALVAANE